MYLLLVTAGLAHAVSPIGNGRNIGIGLQFDTPPAITGRFFFDHYHSLEVDLRPPAIEGIGLEPLGSAGVTYGHLFYGAVTFLWRPSVLVDVPGRVGMSIPWFFGVGGYVADTFEAPLEHGEERVAYTGVRLPVGLDLDLAAVPLQLYLGLTPRLDVWPLAAPKVDLDAGVRWYF
jgi:hypothetical protein